jgi:hypothetical protein
MKNFHLPFSNHITVIDDAREDNGGARRGWQASAGPADGSFFAFVVLVGGNVPSCSWLLTAGFRRKSDWPRKNAKGAKKPGASSTVR